MKKAIIPFSLLIMVALGVFLFLNRFVNYASVEVDGFAFKSNAIYNNLSDSKKQEDISLEPVSINDTIYKSSSNFYVGEEKKTKVNIDYPIVSKDSSTLFIASNLGEYITSDFDREAAYPESMITDGKLYNTSNYEQATDYSYLFVGMNNGLYINVAELKIKTYNDTHVIPVNSFIKFETNALGYYFLSNGEFIYKKIPLIDDANNVVIGNFDGTYRALLINLSLVKVKTDDENKGTNSTIKDGNKTKEDEDEKNKTKEDVEIVEEQENVTISGEIANSSSKYVKVDPSKHPDRDFIIPTVSVNDTYAKTYSYRGIITINDPSSAIVKSPTFTFKYKDGTVAFSKTISSNGSFKVTGLKPSTEYTVSAIFQYLPKGEKNRVEVDIIFNNKGEIDSFTTRSVDEVGPVTFDLGNVTTDTNSFHIDSFKLANKADDEVLNGIKKVVISVPKVNFALTAGEIKNLVNLVDFEYTSVNTLKSYTHYDASISIKDTADNDLIVKNGTFSFTTKQSPPSASIVRTKENNPNFKIAYFNIIVKNPDNVEVINPKYYLFSEDGSLLTTGNIYDGQTEYSVDGLDTAKKYTLTVKCDYRTAEGYYYENYEIGTLPFVSTDVSKLGKVEINVSHDGEDAIDERSIKIIVSSSVLTNNPSMYDILDDTIRIEVVNNEPKSPKYKEVVYEATGKKEDLMEGIKLTIGSDPNWLDSNSNYIINAKTTVTSGTNTIFINTVVTNNKFKTLKAVPYVSLNNLFIASGYIDFDAYVFDPDNVIMTSDKKPTNQILLKVSKAESGGRSKEIAARTIEVSRDIDNPISTTINFDNLDSNGSYYFDFITEYYNDNKTYGSNVILNGSNLFKLSGLSATMNIEEMIKTANKRSPEGENLFDLQDLTRWKSDQAYGNSSAEKITVKNSFENDYEKELYLTSNNGYRVYSYFIPELAGKQITLSYEGRKTTNTTAITDDICVVNGKVNTEGVQNGYKASNCITNTDGSTTLGTSWSQRKATFVLDDTGYINFFLGSKNDGHTTNTAVFRQVQIRVGDETGNELFGSSYKIYAGTSIPAYYGYVGNFVGNLQDGGEAITDNPDVDLNSGEYEYDIILLQNKKDDYESVNSNTTSEDEEENGTVEATGLPEKSIIVENDDIAVDVESLKKGIKETKEIGGIEQNLSYTIALAVMNKLTNRYYIIDSVDFETDAEIRVISESSQLGNMHKRGYYIATNDLDFRSGAGGKKLSGTFNGVLDMQGHKLILDDTSSAIISHLGGGGTIKNAVVDIYLNNTTALHDYWGLVYINYGLIQNVVINLKKANNVNNIGVHFLGWENYGTIDNFIFCAEDNFYGLKTLSFGPRHNYGIIRNGYAYVKQPDDPNEQAPYGFISTYVFANGNPELGEPYDSGEKEIGTFAVNATSGSIIENVYSTIKIRIGSGSGTRDKYVGNIVDSVSGATIRNALVFDDTVASENFRDTTKDIMFGKVSAINYNNLYDISFIKYSNANSKVQIIPALKDPVFMDSVLNKDNRFDTMLGWQTNTFPKLYMPSVMPLQDYNKLPDVNESDFVFSAVNDVYYGEDDSIAKVNLTFYNPKELTIQNIRLNCGSTTNCLTITKKLNKDKTGYVTGDFEQSTNSDKITTVTVYVRDAVKYISNYELDTVTTNQGIISFNNVNVPLVMYRQINSLDAIDRSNQTENYILTDDIDCATSNCGAALSTYKGILNGDNHTISNYRLDNCFIDKLQGRLININFENFTTTGSSTKTGLVCNLESNGYIENVYVKNITLSAYKKNTVVYAGGLAAYVSSGTIIDSAVNIMTVDKTNISTSYPVIGGLVGYGENIIIDTSLARNVDLTLNGSASENAAMGGIIGRMSTGKLSNLYSTGQIKTNINYLGGIAGRITSTTATINSVVAKVNIESQQDSLGGVVGNVVTSNAVSKSLVLNNLTTTKSNPSAFDRTSGTNIVKSRNFAWDKQAINAEVTGNTNGEELISQTDLRNHVSYTSRMGLDSHWVAYDAVLDNYCREKLDTKCIDYVKDADGTIVPKEYSYTAEDYDAISENNRRTSNRYSTIAYMPYLKSANTGIIKGQGYYAGEASTVDDIEDLKINYELKFIISEIRVKPHNASDYLPQSTYGYSDDEKKYYVNQYDLDFVIIRSRDTFVVKDFVVSDVEDTSFTCRTGSVDSNTGEYIVPCTIKMNRTLADGQEYLKDKFYDKYVITAIKYVDNNANLTESIDGLISTPFYGIIRNAGDWEVIEPGRLENYVVVGDVNLGSLNNTAKIKKLYGKSFGKLIGIGSSMPSISTGGASNPVNLSDSGIGLIDTLSSELTNVEFKDIYFNSTGTSNYFGVIKFLNGRMHDVKFDNIHISAPNMTYVGIVASNQSPKIENILIDDNNINGKSKVGFIGQTARNPITSVTLKNMTLTSNGNYTGGLFGYTPWLATWTGYTTYIAADNIKINADKLSTAAEDINKTSNATNSNYAGAIAGYGSLINGIVTNSVVVGNHRVGGILGEYSAYPLTSAFIFDSKVYGNQYVGGLGGIGPRVNSAIGYNTIVNGKNLDVGGVVGYTSGSWFTFEHIYTHNNQVKGLDRVGAMAGRAWREVLQYITIDGATVNGRNYVGGIVGYTDSTDTWVRFNNVKADITATGSYAGSLVGYKNNTTMDTSKYRLYIYKNIVAGSTVKANNYAGGIIGGMTPKPILSGFVYNNMVDAHIETTGGDNTGVGFVNGYNDTNTETLRNISGIRVHRDTTIKKGASGTIKTYDYNVPTITMYSRADASSWNFYKNSSYMTEGRYSGMKSGYYPRPNTSIESNTMANVSTRIQGNSALRGQIIIPSIPTGTNLREFFYLPLPIEGGAGSANVLAGASSNYHEVPEAKVYVSGIDTVNVEFTDTDHETVLVLNDSYYYLDSKTLTFKYNFDSDFNFILTDGNKVRKYEFTANDLANRMTTIGNNYYYFNENHKLSTNDTNVNIKNPVNIFEKYILLSDGKIYDIESHTTNDNSFTNYEKVDTKPLYSFTYLDEEIDTYYTYSIVNGDYYTGQLFVKNDELEIMDKNIRNIKNKIIMDRYNNRDYLLFLSEDGVIYSLKDIINYPDEFNNINIRDISTNINLDTDLLFVLYKNGNYVVFNYKTGTLIDSNFDYKPSIFEYVATRYNETVGANDLDKPISRQYKEAKELVQKLDTVPLDEGVEKAIISTSRIEPSKDSVTDKYSIKYNPNTKTYEVYEMKETDYNDTVDSFKSDNSVIINQISNDSADKVIKKSKDLMRYYNVNNNITINETSSGVNLGIIALIGSIIIILVGLLGNLVIRKIKVRSNA